MKRAALLLACLVVIGAALVMTSPAKAQDPGPVQNALATLAAATAQAEQMRAAQRATAAALSAEATRQTQSAQATAQMVSVMATQSAVDELNWQRAAMATAEYHAAQATRQAQDAQATSQAVMIAAEGTRQAIDAQERAQLAQTYATRQERFTFGLLLVEIGAVVCALWLLWRLALTLAAWADKMRPQNEPTFGGLLEATATPGGPVVIDAQPEPAGRMPDFVQVVDNPAMEEAISRWAERYDAEHGVNYGDE